MKGRIQINAPGVLTTRKPPPPPSSKFPLDVWKNCRLPIVHTFVTTYHEIPTLGQTSTTEGNMKGYSKRIKQTILTSQNTRINEDMRTYTTLHRNTVYKIFIKILTKWKSLNTMNGYFIQTPIHFVRKSFRCGQSPKIWGARYLSDVGNGLRSVWLKNFLSTLERARVFLSYPKCAHRSGSKAAWTSTYCWDPYRCHKGIRGA